MRNTIFVVICLVLSIAATAQVAIVEISEDQATLLLDSLKKNNIGHTHTKQWKKDFVNLEHCREQYSKAVIGIHLLVMPDQINLNEKYNKSFFEVGKLYSEIEELEEKENKDSSDVANLDTKRKRLKYIENVELHKYPVLYASLFERSIEQFYNDSEVELGDTVYVYSSGLPTINEHQEFDESKEYAIVEVEEGRYKYNTSSVNFGIICNRNIEGQMYANRWK